MKQYNNIFIMGNINNEDTFAKGEEYLASKYPNANIYNPVKLKAALPAGCNETEIGNIIMYNLSKCDTVYMLKGWEADCFSNRVYGYASAKRLHIWKEESNGRNNSRRR